MVKQDSNIFELLFPLHSVNFINQTRSEKKEMRQSYPLKLPVVTNFGVTFVFSSTFPSCSDRFLHFDEQCHRLRFKPKSIHEIPRIQGVVLGLFEPYKKRKKEKQKTKD